jgi:cold shock CspA family protein
MTDTTVTATATTTSTTTTTTSTPVKVGSLLGQVKWFRNGPGFGYGFITCVSENTPQFGQDIYVYQVNVFPSVSTFRTLYKDEYVSFDVSEEERQQALNVRGVGGGPLRCDSPTPRPRTSRGRRNNNRSGSSSSVPAGSSAPSGSTSSR